MAPVELVNLESLTSRTKVYSAGTLSW